MGWKLTIGGGEKDDTQNETLFTMPSVDSSTQETGRRISVSLKQSGLHKEDYIDTLAQ